MMLVGRFGVTTLNSYQSLRHRRYITDLVVLTFIIAAFDISVDIGTVGNT